MNEFSFRLRRDDVDRLKHYGLTFEQSWQVVDHFERSIAGFFGAPYAVAVDCCTHALELSLRIQSATTISVPRYTYMSVPMIAEKLNLDWRFDDRQWTDRYELTPNIIDAATSWQAKSYQSGTLTSVSFQFKKHIPIGRGGVILLDDEEKYHKLHRMVHDGRDPQKTQFEDNVSELGYHYYMTPEDAARGIELFINLKDQPARAWSWQDYRDLMEMDYFKRKFNVS